MSSNRQSIRSPRLHDGRVAVVTEIIAPYRIPLFNELSRLLAGRLDVIFISETEPRRAWPIDTAEIDFSYSVLGGLRFTIPYRGDQQPIYLARPLLPRLVRGDYSALVVGGWNHFECYQALAYARWTRRPMVFWSETPLLDGVPKRPVRNRVKRLVVDGSATYIAAGASAARYLEGLGAPPSLIHVAPNSVDHRFWRARPEGADRRRQITLLFVGRLVRSKGADIAVRAFAQSDLATSAQFLIVGDGPERSRLETLAPASVRFLGELGRLEIRRLYHSSHLLVIPSLYDPWGVVVNEASCASLPVVASDGVGAARDHIVDGVNGFLVRRGSVDALRAVFDRLAADITVIEPLRIQARAISERCSTEVAAAGIVEAIDAALRRS